MHPNSPLPSSRRSPAFTIIELTLTIGLLVSLALLTLEVVNPMQDWQLGKKAGVVLDPASPLDAVEYVLHLCDVIMIMTVNPGFAGQSFLPEMLPKIRRLRALCEARGLDPFIEVDGGQNREHARQSVEAGANVIVAGSAIFGSKDYAAAISAIRGLNP